MMAADELAADLSTERSVAVAVGHADAVGLPVGAFTRAKFAVVRAFLWGWTRAFSLRGLYWLGLAFGTCEWLINYKRRRRIRQRLREIYAAPVPPPAARHAVRRHFMRVRCEKLCYLIFDHLPREKILRRVRFHGKEHLDRALARGKGVVIVLGHSGPHHVALLLMALMQYRLVGIRDRKEGALRRYVREQLAKSFPEFGAVRMFFSDAYPRDLYRALQEEHILCGALDVSRDRGVQSSTSRVRIFGREQEFVNGAMKIALRCGAPVLQGFIVGRRDFYFRLTVTEPLIDPDTVDKNEQSAIDAAMQKYADNIEQHVRRYPCQLSRI